MSPPHPHPHLWCPHARLFGNTRPHNSRSPPASDSFCFFFVSSLLFSGFGFVLGVSCFGSWFGFLGLTRAPRAIQYVTGFAGTKSRCRQASSLRVAAMLWARLTQWCRSSVCCVAALARKRLASIAAAGTATTFFFFLVSDHGKAHAARSAHT